MARNPTYIGPRLKRLRRDLGLTQANMAADLEISPSYVALMERNQRPVTADLLLALVRAYKIDLAYLDDGGADDMSMRMKGVLADPIFSDIDLPSLDIADIAANYPGFGEAFLRLHTAYSEEQLALAESRARGALGSVQGAADPVGAVRAFLAARRNCFPTLDDAAAALASDGTSVEALCARLEQRHNIAVRFVDPSVIMGAVRWHDQHRQRLNLSMLLDHPTRRFQLALQIGVLEAQEPINQILRDSQIAGENTRRLIRRALQNYWAAALLMPYRSFLRSVRKARYDIEVLTREYGVSFEQVAHRLTTLQHRGEEGVPFIFLRVDRAGNVSKRLDGGGFALAQHGGACPLWNIHDTFDSPGSLHIQKLELPDGQRYISIARTVKSGGGGFNATSISRSVAIATLDIYAEHLVYGDTLRDTQPTPIGLTCQVCHRPHCIARSAPPIGREIRGDDFRGTSVPFAFADD